MGIYTSTLEYLKPSFVKENFEQMKYFLPQEDIPYYTRVLRDGAFIYYSEYKDALYKKTLTSLEKDLSIDGGNGKNQTLTKSTPYSALYTSNDESNKAAFVHYFALPFLIISLSFLIPLFAFLFALMGRF